MRRLLASALLPCAVALCSTEVQSWCASCSGRYNAVHCTCACPLSRSERDFYTLVGFSALSLVLLLF